jgi:uncharacterized protein YneF (UPF0154 family)
MVTDCCWWCYCGLGLLPMMALIIVVPIIAFCVGWLIGDYICKKVIDKLDDKNEELKNEL